MYFWSRNSKKDIYYKKPNYTRVNTEDLFDISIEDDNLRVKNIYVNVLFGNLDKEEFDRIYNLFDSRLNLNFEPILLDGQTFSLNEDEQNGLNAKIITRWIYFYSVNNKKIIPKRKDFNHPYTIEYIFDTMDSKFGIDSDVSFKVGAAIFRKSLRKYKRLVILCKKSRDQITKFYS